MIETAFEEIILHESSGEMFTPYLLAGILVASAFALILFVVWRRPLAAGAAGDLPDAREFTIIDVTPPTS